MGIITGRLIHSHHTEIVTVMVNNQSTEIRVKVHHTTILVNNKMLHHHTLQLRTTSLSTGQDLGGARVQLLENSLRLFEALKCSWVQLGGARTFRKPWKRC